MTDYKHDRQHQVLEYQPIESAYLISRQRKRRNNMFKTQLFTLSIFLGLFLGCEQQQVTSSTIENVNASWLVGTWFPNHDEQVMHQLRVLKFNGDGTAIVYELVNEISDEEIWAMSNGDTYYRSYKAEESFRYTITNDKLNIFNFQDILVECSGEKNIQVTYTCGNGDTIDTLTVYSCENYSNCIECDKQKPSSCSNNGSSDEIVSIPFIISEEDSLLTFIGNSEGHSVVFHKETEDKLYERQSGVVNILPIDWNE